MLQDFVIRHKILTAIITLIVIGGIIGLAIAGTFNTQQTTTQTPGTDGPGEVYQLPYTSFLYSIDEPTKDHEIDVTAYQGYRNTAVTYLSKHGLDPADYRINFNNYENPFTPYE